MGLRDRLSDYVKEWASEEEVPRAERFCMAVESFKQYSPEDLRERAISEFISGDVSSEVLQAIAHFSKASALANLAILFSMEDNPDSEIN